MVLLTKKRADCFRDSSLVRGQIAISSVLTTGEIPTETSFKLAMSVKGEVITTTRQTKVPSSVKITIFDSLTGFLTVVLTFSHLFSTHFREVLGVPITLKLFFQKIQASNQSNIRN